MNSSDIIIYALVFLRNIAVFTLVSYGRCASVIVYYTDYCNKKLKI